MPDEKNNARQNTADLETQPELKKQKLTSQDGAKPDESSKTCTDSPTNLTPTDVDKDQQPTLDNKTEDDDKKNDENRGKKSSNFDNKNNKNNKKKNKKKNERKKFVHRPWNEEDEGEDSEANAYFRKRDKQPHEGSYANPLMKHLAPKDDNSDTSKANEPGADGDGGDPLFEISTAPQPPQQPKKKVAIFLAYLGQNYGGMQMNAGQRTIQAELEYACYKAGFLGGGPNATNYGYPHKYSWSTSARTDRGVHACAQVVSLKIRFPPQGEGEGGNDDDGTDLVRKRLTEILPNDICVLDVVRTTRNFCAHTGRDKARYQYVFPSFVLQDRDELRKAFRTHCPSVFAAPTKDDDEDDKETKSDNIIEDAMPTAEEMQAMYNCLKSYRANDSQLERLRSGLQAYVGTHSFHNYTKGKTPGDMSANRYIISFNVLDPVLSSEEKGGIEWIPCQVVGQSFLLHQIRKMMSMALDVARKGTTLEVQRTSFDTSTIMRTDIAPAQGLFLDMSYFERYNNRNSNNDPLDWSSKDVDHSNKTKEAIERWARFKREKVIPHIMEEEGKEKNFITYLYNHEFKFDVKTYDKVIKIQPSQDGKRRKQKKDEGNDAEKEDEKSTEENST